MIAQTFEQLFADLAVEDPVDVIIVGEQERKAQRLELGAVVGLLAGGEHHGVQRAHLDHLDHLSVGTELLGGEDLDLDLAVGAFLDGFGKVLKGDVNQVLGGVAVADTDGVLLAIVCGGFGGGVAALAAAGSQAEDHQHGEDQGNNLLRVFHLRVLPPEMIFILSGAPDRIRYCRLQPERREALRCAPRALISLVACITTVHLNPQSCQ